MAANYVCDICGNALTEGEEAMHGAVGDMVQSPNGGAIIKKHGGNWHTFYGERNNITFRFVAHIGEGIHVHTLCLLDVMRDAHEAEHAKTSERLTAIREAKAAIQTKA